MTLPPYSPEASGRIPADQPLTSIESSASPEAEALKQQLTEIETNYRSRLEELQTAEQKESGRLERGVHNPRVEEETRRAHNPKVETPKGEIWKKIRELAGLHDASKVEPVSPRAVITKNGQRLRVDDGITAPLR